MPCEPCSKNGKRGWRWGKHGTCYTGADGKSKCERQGRAAFANGYRPKRGRVLLTVCTILSAAAVAVGLFMITHAAS